MQKSSHTINLTVLGVALGAVVSVSMSPGFSTLWDSIVGIIFLIFLIKYGVPQSSDTRGRIVFAPVFGFCAMITISFGIDHLLINNFGFQLEDLQLPINMRDALHLVIWMLFSLIGKSFIKMNDKSQNNEKEKT